VVAAQYKAELVNEISAKIRPRRSDRFEITIRLVSARSQYDIFTVGAGYLDVWAALNSTDTAQGTAVSPQASFNSKTGVTHTCHRYERQLGIQRRLGQQHFAGIERHLVLQRHLGYCGVQLGNHRHQGRAIDRIAGLETLARRDDLRVVRRGPGCHTR
jgi:chitodextrinase